MTSALGPVEETGLRSAQLPATCVRLSSKLLRLIGGHIALRSVDLHEANHNS